MAPNQVLRHSGYQTVIPLNPATVWLSCLLVMANFPLSAQGTPLEGGLAREITIAPCHGINNERVQYAPAIFGDQLVYVNRPKRGPTDPLTREVFLQRYRARIKPDGTLGKPRPFGRELSGNFNEGPVSFTQEDRVIYFSRNQQRAGGAQPDREGTTNLGIYSAYLAEYGWADIEALPFNNREFSNQQPSLTPDGRRIFFASNRPGGYGGYDLYFSDYFEGRWAAPINLGPEINTAGNDVFPYFHPSGRLFFASNGHAGQGGLDLFVVDISGRRWGRVLNLPAPLNGPADETGFALGEDGRRGYLSSNRSGGAGQDDVYRFELRRGLESLGGVAVGGEEVTVYDAATSGRVGQARLWLVEISPGGRPDPAFTTLRLRKAPAPGGPARIEVHPKPVAYLPPPATTTGLDGTARVELIIGKTYELRVAHPGYSPESLRFKFGAEGPSRPLRIVLQPIPCRNIALRMTEPGGGAARRTLDLSSDGTCGGTQLTSDLLGYVEPCLSAECNYRLTPAEGLQGQVPGFTEARQTFMHPIFGRAAPAAEVLSLGNGGPGSVVVAPRLSADGFARIDLRVPAAPFGSAELADDVGATLELIGLQFVGNTAVLQINQSPDLELLYGFLRDRPGLRLTLAAHNDGPASPTDLVQLGDARARAVINYLVDRGIAADRLRRVAYGNRFRREPCQDCTPAQHARNTWMDARVDAW